MKFLSLMIFLVCFENCHSQQKLDTKIIITLSDSKDVYTELKTALANSGFIVVDNGKKDTVDTQPKEMLFMPGYMSIRSILAGNVVIMTGVYGLNRIAAWGFTKIPKDYKRVVYYKGSKTWRVLVDTAIRLQGELSFSREE